MEIMLVINEDGKNKTVDKIIGDQVITNTLKSKKLEPGPNGECTMTVEDLEAGFESFLSRMRMLSSMSPKLKEEIDKAVLKSIDEYHKKILTWYKAQDDLAEEVYRLFGKDYFVQDPATTKVYTVARPKTTIRIIPKWEIQKVKDQTAKEMGFAVKKQTRKKK